MLLILVDYCLHSFLTSIFINLMLHVSNVENIVYVLLQIAYFKDCENQ